MTMRLNKYLAQLGICSRRKADELIDSGKVFVNAKPAEQGYQVQDQDKVRVFDKEYIFSEANEFEKYYLVLNKPAGFVTSFEESEASLNDLIKKENFQASDEEFEKIKELKFHYAGRLDKESTGMLLLTNDGDLSYQLTHPKFESEKEYLVSAEKKITANFVEALSLGVEISPEEGEESVITNPCFVEAIDDFRLRIILNQGYKRQIRLMFRALGNRVKELHRMRIANLALKEYKIFFQPASKTTYTNMIILDRLAEGQFSLVPKPEILN